MIEYRPLVSVILPTYNRKHIVLRAIHSVFHQTYTNWELILIDDGSTDGSFIFLEKEIENWKSRKTKNGRLDSNEGRFVSDVHLIRSENRGVSSARNLGLKQAQGEWVAFIDSDDEWHPEKIERQILFHKLEPGLPFSQTIEIWNKKGNLQMPQARFQKKAKDYFYDSLNTCMVTVSSFFAKRNTLKEVGGFREELLACEDYDLWNRIFLKGYEIGLLEETLLVRYGGHSDQLSAKFQAMERFRLYSLLRTKGEAVQSGDWEMVPIWKRNHWDDIIEKKTKILITGRKKRGLSTDFLERILELQKGEQNLDSTPTTAFRWNLVSEEAKYLLDPKRFT
ncbi:MAG: glycosyltransferase family 2 protein [Leptospira sp.]|jgi:glycosyltransferase involved in cell wall biosynthesis|nr:glycosyltransferase family 2 protein [Leptospira sp.]